MVDVSVVIPTRERRPLVLTAVATAVAQVGVSVEVVVVDDGSGDGTAEAVDDLGDERVTVVRHAVPRGVSAARNSGIAAATGRWVAFLDDDDVWAPEKLDRQLQALAAGGRRWCYCGDVYVDDGLRPVMGRASAEPDVVAAELVRSNAVPAGGSTVVVDRRLLADVGPFDPGLRRTEDWDMWLRLLGSGPPAGVLQPLVACRLHWGNVAGEVESMVAEVEVVARRHHLQLRRADALRRAGWANLRGGRRLAAARCYLRAVALGDLGSAGRLAVALFHPGATSDRLYALGGGRADPAWLAAADLWLSGLRRTLVEAGRREAP